MLGKKPFLLWKLCLVQIHSFSGNCSDHLEPCHISHQNNNLCTDPLYSPTHQILLGVSLHLPDATYRDRPLSNSQVANQRWFLHH